MIAKKGKKMTPRTPCKQHDTIVEKLKAITDRYEGHEEWLSELKVKVKNLVISVLQFTKRRICVLVRLTLSSRIDFCSESVFNLLNGFFERHN